MSELAEDERVPLWRLALRERAKILASRSMSASARILLRDLLVRAGCEVSLVTVHLWPRPWQGTAYLWARRTLDGDVSLAPYHVRFVMAEAERSKTVRST